jgi:hypothetical protein
MSDQRTARRSAAGLGNQRGPAAVGRTRSWTLVLLAYLLLIALFYRGVLPAAMQP